MSWVRGVAILVFAGLFGGCAEDPPGGAVDPGRFSDAGPGGGETDAQVGPGRDGGGGGEDDGGGGGETDGGGGGETDGGSWNSGCGEVEICDNGLDDNCDGRVDENCACAGGTTQECYGGFPVHAGLGVCHLGTQECPSNEDVPAWGPCTGWGSPEEVVCGSGRDSLCTGNIDEGCECSPGDERACYSGPAGTEGVGLCQAGTQTCVGQGSQASWGPCLGEILPAAQNSCDGQDHLCNGRPYEGCDCIPGETRGCYDGPPGTENVGLCRAGTQTCAEVNGVPTWGACTGQTVPATTNPCDGQDHLCNGSPYDGCACIPNQSRSCYSGPGGTAGVGLCRDGTQSCILSNGVPAWGPCVGEVTPSPNTCDGLDRLCTGNPEAGGCTCTLATTRPCYTGPAGTAGVGLCHGGTETCVPRPGGMAGSEWGACTGQVTPQPNLCDGVDRLCDGMPLSGCVCQLNQTRPCYDGPPATRGIGACRDGTQTCVAASMGTQWSAACSGQVLPRAAGEICGNGIDDDCNGQIDDGCAPTITCPANTTTPAGTPVTLTVNASSPAGAIAGYQWTIIQAPTGGIGTVNQWMPNPPTAATEIFRPFIVGVYRIRVTATDVANQTASCEMEVTAQGHGLRVQLTWNGTGDVDLHVHSPTVSAPWFTSPHDCFYANRTPIWDSAWPAGQGGNPMLDFDNVTANGPENTRIDFPQIGVPYTIAAHNYANAAGRIATVEIFCGQVSTPTAVFTSRALLGTSAGNCTANDFWRVAQVTFSNTASCVVTPINTYGPSSAACTSF